MILSTWACILPGNMLELAWDIQYLFFWTWITTHEYHFSNFTQFSANLFFLQPTRVILT